MLALATVSKAEVLILLKGVVREQFSLLANSLFTLRGDLRQPSPVICKSHEL